MMMMVLMMLIMMMMMVMMMMMRMIHIGEPEQQQATRHPGRSLGHSVH